jgi:hypothetical protein
MPPPARRLLVDRVLCFQADDRPGDQQSFLHKEIEGAVGVGNADAAGGAAPRE